MGSWVINGRRGSTIRQILWDSCGIPILSLQSRYHMGKWGSERWRDLPTSHSPRVWLPPHHARISISHSAIGYELNGFADFLPSAPIRHNHLFAKQPTPSPCQSCGSLPSPARKPQKCRHIASFASGTGLGKRRRWAKREEFPSLPWLLPHDAESLS